MSIQTIIEEFKREIEYNISKILMSHETKNKNISRYNYNWCTSSCLLDKNEQLIRKLKIGINLTVIFNANKVSEYAGIDERMFNTNIIFHTYDTDEVLNTSNVDNAFDRAKIDIN